MGFDIGNRYIIIFQKSDSSLWQDRFEIKAWNKDNALYSFKAKYPGCRIISIDEIRMPY